MNLYHQFGKNICDEGYLKFDKIAQEQLFVSESWGMKAYESHFGDSQIDPLNGYHHGKRWFNITLASWIEDIKRGLLTIDELAKDFDPYVISKIPK